MAAAVVIGLGLSTFDAVRQGLPRVDDECVVEITGQPGASKKDLYYLALSTAMSMVRNDGLVSVFPTMGMIMIEYDAADHWVRATVRYTSGAKGYGNGGSEYQVYKGPNCEVIGENFNFTDDTLFGKGLVGIPTTAKAPKLPWKGRTILTSCPTVTKSPAPGFDAPTTLGAPIPTPNPKPPGDNRSRGVVITPATGSVKSETPGAAAPGGGFSGSRPIGSNDGTPLDASCCKKGQSLVAMVFAALTAPGSVQYEGFVPPVGGPTGS